MRLENKIRWKCGSGAAAGAQTNEVSATQPEHRRPGEIMANKIIVIGASAGGFSALHSLFANLDPDLKATIFTVLHTSPSSPSYLVPLFSQWSTMTVKSAGTGRFDSSTIYIAPPDRHVIIERGSMRLSQGPKENCARPAIDVTFRSAALAYRSAVIGVVLTGMLDDGTAGLFYVKRHGGITIIQDPQEAEFASMPANALAHVRIDYKLPLAEIAPTINQLAALDSAQFDLIRQTAGRNGIEAMLETDKRQSVLTRYTCPECHGPLSRVEDGSPTRFRCRVGHAYGQNSLYDAQANYVEQVIWSSFQALQAKAEMEESLRQEAESRGDSAAMAVFKAASDDTHRRIATFSQVLQLSQAENEIAAE
jgi:two-component system, chemotaxis family, protein-glutamate methylesterase/glutaminase